jgi:hypothetical protein
VCTPSLAIAVGGVYLFNKGGNYARSEESKAVSA